MSVKNPIWFVMRIGPSRVVSKLFPYGEEKVVSFSSWETCVYDTSGVMFPWQREIKLVSRWQWGTCLHVNDTIFSRRQRGIFQRQIGLGLQLAMMSNVCLSAIGERFNVTGDFIHGYNLACFRRRIYDYSKHRAMLHGDTGLRRGLWEDCEWKTFITNRHTR